MICDLHDLLDHPDADSLETMAPQGRQRDVEDPAHIFDVGCREADVVPYVVTKKTVLKGQKGFGQKMKEVFEAGNEPRRPARKGDGPEVRESAPPLSSSTPRESTVGWKPWAHANNDEPKARLRNGEQHQQPWPPARGAQESGLLDKCSCAPRLHHQ